MCRSGTLRDKIAALSMAVRETVPYCLSYLRSLASMLEKKNRHESFLALEAMQSLFLSHLLPPSRKLRHFDQQPWQSPGASKAQMVLWHFEDSVKSEYLQCLRYLEQLLSEKLVFTRTSCLSLAWQLLVERPEQEASLLALITNKLGDTDNKVASKAAYLLLLTSQKHPAMIEVLIQECRKYLERESTAKRFLYYACIFMNQIVLAGEGGVQNASSLLEAYFSLAGRLLGKSEELENTETQRLFSALLTGINRAYPFAKLSSTVAQRYVAQLFQLALGWNFNCSIQSLNLLFSIVNTKSHDIDQRLKDRFYDVLYQVLSRLAVIEASSKQPLLLNLLFKAMRADSDCERFRAFTKRLLLICSFLQPPFSCAILMMLLQQQRCNPIASGEKFFQDSDTVAEFDSTTHNSRATGVTGKHLRAQLELLKMHYHPSVCRYAGLLLASGKDALPRVDPFEAYSVATLLGKFSYDAPKLLKKDEAFGTMLPRTKGISAMQPIRNPEHLVRSQDPVNRRLVGRLSRGKNVAEDEIFFSEFFKTLPEKEASKKKSKDSDGEDDWDADVGVDVDDDVPSDFDEESQEGEMDFDEESQEGGFDEDSEDPEEAIEEKASGPEDHCPDECEPEESARKKKRKLFKGLGTFVDASEYLSD